MDIDSFHANTQLKFMQIGIPFCQFGSVTNGGAYSTLSNMRVCDFRWSKVQRFGWLIYKTKQFIRHFFQQKCEKNAEENQWNAVEVLEMNSLNEIIAFLKSHIDSWI